MIRERTKLGFIQTPMEGRVVHFGAVLLAAGILSAPLLACWHNRRNEEGGIGDERQGLVLQVWQG